MVPLSPTLQSLPTSHALKRGAKGDVMDSNQPISLTPSDPQLSLSPGPLLCNPKFLCPILVLCTHCYNSGCKIRQRQVVLPPSLPTDY